MFSQGNKLKVVFVFFMLPCLHDRCMLVYSSGCIIIRRFQLFSPAGTNIGKLLKFFFITAPGSPLIPGSGLLFSSYPGNLYSGDDFYIITSNLVSGAWYKPQILSTNWLISTDHGRQYRSNTSILTNDRPVECCYEEKSFRQVSELACVWLWY